MNIAHDEGDCGFLARLRLAPAIGAGSGPAGRSAIRRGSQLFFKPVDPELSPAGGEVGLGYLLDYGMGHTSIISCSHVRQCSSVTIHACGRHRRCLVEGEKTGGHCGPPKFTS